MNYYYHQTPPKSPRGNKIKLPKKLPLFAIPVLVITIFILLFSTNNTNSTTPHIIKINKGDSVSQIANTLKEKDLISSEFFFKRYLTSNNIDQNIQVGSFQIPEGLEYSEIAEILVNPSEVNTAKITVPEGFKISQIDARLAQLELINPGEFLACTQNCQIDHPILDYIPQGKNSLEGFLYPDTYFIDPSEYSNEDLIYKMLDNFQSKLPENWQTLAQNLPETDLYSIVTMASILEREVLSKSERQMAADIFWRRYSADWRLDADASVLYDQDDNILTASDLQSDSPYNLRKFKGLSPTPIANPSINSIEATLNPISNPYWFYITTLDTGEVIYAETIDQHNQNVARYLR